jgi:UPF0176 protein
MQTPNAPYWVLAYYIFTEIKDPHDLVQNHKDFFEGRDVSGRIYISEEGINGQMSGTRADAEAFMTWLKSDERFEGIWFKIHGSEENVFPRMTVKYRQQLVAMDKKVDARESDGHLSPEEWARMLREEEDLVVLDVRNDYEWEIGHFHRAEKPGCDTFREFPAYADKLKEEVDPKKTKVMMYCTGGIRCELYSVLMKEKGFENVYQLHGGVIGYGLERGNDLWDGKLFVFDDRIAIPLAEEGGTSIGKCHCCGETEDHYYNCANADCNKLFVSCEKCLAEKKGCCCEACGTAPRVRPRKYCGGNKPFRRLHLCRD